jgi:thiol:disulfide interchange protein
MEPRKALTLLFLTLLLGVGYASMNAAPVKSDETYSYHGDTEWRTNVSAAQDLARANDQPVLVYFWTTWCTYCEDYNQQVYSDPVVQEELDEFVLVAVNLDSSRPQATRSMRRYNVSYPPQHVATTADGQRLAKLPGYAERDDFLAFLSRARQQYRRQA